MDLEVLMRACWRRRTWLALAALAGALVVAIGGRMVEPRQFAASTDVEVFLPQSADTSQNSVYALQPDRFVSTQVATIASPATQAAVAAKLGLTVDEVADMARVAQVGKSDLIRITATSGDAGVSAQVATAMAEDYVDSVTKSTKATYENRIKSLEDQATSVANQITETRQAITNLGQSTTEPGQLQRALNDLLGQQSSLTSQRQALQVDLAADATGTRIVSGADNATVDVGTSTKIYVLYGALLGLGLAACWVALTTGPGRNLTDLGAEEDFHDVDVIGVAESRPARWPWTLLPETRRAGVRSLSVANELQSLMRIKGPIAIVPVGSERRVLRCVDTLNACLLRTPRQREMPGVPTTIGSIIPLASISSFDEMELPVLVLAADVNASPDELADVIDALRSMGTDVVGLIGVS